MAEHSSSLLAGWQKSAGLWSLRGHPWSVWQWQCMGIQMVPIAGTYVHARDLRNRLCYVVLQRSCLADPRVLTSFNGLNVFFHWDRITYIFYPWLPHISIIVMQQFALSPIVLCAQLSCTAPKMHASLFSRPPLSECMCKSGSGSIAGVPKAYETY